MVRDMTKGSPVRHLLLFALPLLLGNVFQQLYSVVDAMVLGRGVGVEAIAVDDTTALRWRLLYPDWSTGITYKIADKVQHEDKLYRCLQGHTSQAGWEPGVATASLWTEICETHSGTIDDPIPYSGNMALVAGKYYSQDDVTYRCTRDTEIPVYHPLQELVGLYVEIANQNEVTV